MSTIMTMPALRAAVLRKRTEDIDLSFEGAVRAVADEAHLSIDDVLRAFHPEEAQA